MPCLRILNDPPKALRIHGILKLPESIARQVRACEKLSPPGQAEGLPFVPDLLEGARRLWWPC